MQYLTNKQIKAMKSELVRYGVKSKRLIMHDNLILNEAKDPLFIKIDDQLVPTLYLDADLPCVTVDMKAISFVVNGADIMRPGIVNFDEFLKGDVVKVVDEQHKKAIAIGIALFSSQEIQTMNKGKVIKNIHWIGDKIFKKEYLL